MGVRVSKASRGIRGGKRVNPGSYIRSGTGNGVKSAALKREGSSRGPISNGGGGGGGRGGR